MRPAFIASVKVLIKRLVYQECDERSKHLHRKIVTIQSSQRQEHLNILVVLMIGRRQLASKVDRVITQRVLSWEAPDNWGLKQNSSGKWQNNL
jgi:hypothetical protein